MREIKVGDLVRIKQGHSVAACVWTSGMERHVGSEETVTAVGTRYITLNGSPWSWMPEWLELIDVKENRNTMSTLIEKAVLAVTPEPQKSFRKAGITNGDGILTDEGAKVFLSFLLSKYQDEFKTTTVDPILADSK